MAAVHHRIHAVVPREWAALRTWARSRRATSLVKLLDAQVDIARHNEQLGRELWQSCLRLAESLAAMPVRM
jgi:hypothetical protein